MTETIDELEYLVLQSVANDFEEFEMIINEITKCTDKKEAAPNAELIQQALMRAIAEGTVKVYEVREGHHHLIAPETDSPQVRSSWFYITEQGKMRMQKIEGEAKRT
jgi:hypothetical protein